MVLYINSCVRAESRTNRLAKVLLDKLGAYEEVKLNEMEMKPLNLNCQNSLQKQILL